MKATLTGALLGATIFANAASAQLVYDNGVGGPAGLTSSLVADNTVPQTVADQVVFQPDQAVARIEWTGVYTGGDTVPPATDNFVINIRSDAFGSPGAVIATFPAGDNVSRTLISPSGGTLSNVYQYNADISFTFITGLVYWIEIENDNGNRDDDAWAWGTGPTNAGGSVWFSQNLGANWFDTTFPGTDFRLYADTPPCLADTNHDGQVTPADFSAWVAAFNQMGPECDQNGDGLCSPADFSAWVANFNAGCG
ncbi:MAG: hypothetical protein KDA31_09140 [Phycisphaerales bacterium]|nr:hypothetical protein [Phycisphaerales bacterium]